jgi:Putative zinc-finger/Gram-negative bacterial TonB protein C-terminal
MMLCGGVRRRMSAHLDGELAPHEARAVATHLTRCGACGRRWLSLRQTLEMLSELPRLDSVEGIATRVRDRLEVESRGPGLALLFRPVWAARPLMLSSLLQAVIVLVAVVAGAIALDRDPGAATASTPAVARADRWDSRLPPWGSESNPRFPSEEVSTPRSRGAERFPEQLLENMDEGTLFLETVVARDGSVSSVSLLGGDSAKAQPLLDALRRERFEPGRFHGRPVAVSVYWLISRMDVRAPIT